MLIIEYEKTPEQTGSSGIFIYLYTTAILLIKAVEITAIIIVAVLIKVIKLAFISHVFRVI